MFDICFDRVFSNEGDFQDNPRDRGNWTSGIIGRGKLVGTKFGISAMSYPNIDIPNLTYNHAKAIYANDWWTPLNMPLMPKVLQFQAFDAAVNHGMLTATKLIQHAAFVEPDGIIGPITRKALDEMDKNDLVMRFLSERLLFMTNVSTWNEFGKGWARRIAHNLNYATQDN